MDLVFIGVWKICIDKDIVAPNSINNIMVHCQDSLLTSEAFFMSLNDVNISGALNNNILFFRVNFEINKID